MASPINTFTAILFIVSAAIFTLSLMYVHNLKNKMNYTNFRETEGEYKTGMGNIGEGDRIQFISRCNKVNQQLEGLLSNQLISVDNNHKQLLMEKKQYIKSIKDIVNDLSFNNRQHFEQLHLILKEIHRDVEGQNKRIVSLEQKVSKGDAMKNELANMLIQRMVNDSSKKALKSSKLQNLLESEGTGFENKEEELKMLEKYIIKTIRKQLKQEMSKTVSQQPIGKTVSQQPINPNINNELERKLELMDLVNHKLRTMENLYRNLHSPNKKQIITVIKEPVQKSITPYVSGEAEVETKKVRKLPKCSSKLLKSKKHSLKLNKKPDEANTYYVTDDED